MPNIQQIIDMNNRKILNNYNKKDEEPTKSVCCKDKDKCPLKEVKKLCSTENVVYKAFVKTSSETKSYIGLTANSFKKRWYAHQETFRKEQLKNNTALALYIWELKNRNEKFEIKWDIIKRIKKPSFGTKMCRLCITEAAEILKNKDNPLNKKSEMMGCCRHRHKFTLRNWKKDKKKTPYKLKI